MTILFTTTYEGVNQSRMPLIKRWCEYYQNIQHLLKYDKLVLIDNCSRIDSLREYIDCHAPTADIFRLSDMLLRKGHLNYPYWYRGQKTIQSLLHYYCPERFYYIEVDSFILTQTCINELHRARNGYYSLWSPEYHFSTSEFQMAEGTGIKDFLEWQIGDIFSYAGQHCEHLIPCKPIHLTGGRLGEPAFGLKAIPENLHWISQVDMNLSPVFRTDL